MEECVWAGLECEILVRLRGRLQGIERRQMDRKKRER